MKVSLITATYNSEATVLRAIQSASQQGHEDIEHIIMDGGSTDSTLKLLASAPHPNRRIVSEPDRGIYDALNKGVKIASGDLIGFLHSDDFLAHEHVIADMVAALQASGADGIYGDLDYVSRADESKVIRRWKAGPFTPSSLRNGWMPPHPTLFLRKEVYQAIGEFDLRYRIAADYDFILRLFSSGRFKIIYHPSVVYGMRVGGISNRSLRSVIHKSREDWHALKTNGLSPLHTLFAKNLRKLSQFRIAM